MWYGGKKKEKMLLWEIKLTTEYPHGDILSGEEYDFHHVFSPCVLNWSLMTLTFLSNAVIVYHCWLLNPCRVRSSWGISSVSQCYRQLWEKWLLDFSYYWICIYCHTFAKTAINRHEHLCHFVSFITANNVFQWFTIGELLLPTLCY